MGLRLAVSRGDTVSQAVLTVTEDALLIVLDGGAGESCTYVVTDPDTVAAVAQTLNDLFPEQPAEDEIPDFESMTDEELDAYMTELEKQLEDMGVPAEDEQTSEEYEQAMEDLDRIAELLESCITEGEPQEHLGDTYHTTNINIDSDTFAQLLDLAGMPQIIGEDADMAGLMAQAGMTVALDGVIAVSEDAQKLAYGLHPVFSSDDGDCLELNMTLQNIDTADVVDIYIQALFNGDPLASFSLTVEDHMLEDADWLSAEPAPDAIPLDLNDEQSLDGFVEGLSDFLGQVSGSVIGVSLGNRLIGALH